MVVAKRRGGEKPVKIEQRKVRGPQADQTALLASPVYIGQAQGEGKTYKRRSQSVFSLLRTGALPHSLLFASLGWHALTPQGRIFLLLSK